MQVETRRRPKRKAKASGNVRRNQKTSDVEDHRNTEMNAAERQVGQQRDLPKRITKSPPGDSLPRHTEMSTGKSTVKSLSQVLPTSPKTIWMQSTETHREVCQEVNQHTTEAVNRKRTHAVDRMVIVEDFDGRLPCQAASGSQCHLPMTTAGEIFCEALTEGSREHRRTWTW